MYCSNWHKHTRYCTIFKNSNIKVIKFRIKYFYKWNKNAEEINLLNYTWRSHYFLKNLYMFINKTVKAKIYWLNKIAKLIENNCSKLEILKSIKDKFTKLYIFEIRKISWIQTSKNFQGVLLKKKHCFLHSVWDFLPGTF